MLLRNPDAVQIGLTATPRKLELTERTPESQAAARVSADNLRHFGPPVYEYDMSPGIEDGYLAACEIVRRDIFLDDKPRNERETGVEQAGLRTRSPVTPTGAEPSHHERSPRGQARSARAAEPGVDLTFDPHSDVTALADPAPPRIAPNAPTDAGGTARHTSESKTTRLTRSSCAGGSRPGR